MSRSLVVDLTEGRVAVPAQQCAELPSVAKWVRARLDELSGVIS
jgi:hypothetical protein